MPPKLKSSKCKPRKNQKLYEVEKILNKKIENGKPFYLIKWEGYPESASTWEPLDNLNGVLDLVDSYEDNSKFSKGDGKEKVQTKKSAIPKKITIIEDSDDSAIEEKKPEATTRSKPIIKVTGKRGGFRRKITPREKTPIKIAKKKRSRDEVSVEKKESSPIPTPRKKFKLEGMKPRLMLAKRKETIEIPKPRFKKLKTKVVLKASKVKPRGIKGKPREPPLMIIEESSNKKQYVSPLGEIELELNKLAIDPIEKKKGKFEFGDVAEEIVRVTPAQNKNNSAELLCWIKWRERPDGFTPVMSQVSNTLIKAHDPLLLIKFYESKLHFGNSNSNNSNQNKSNSDSLVPTEKEKTDKEISLNQIGNHDSTPNEDKTQVNQSLVNLKAFKKQEFKKNEKENNNVQSQANTLILGENEEESQQDNEVKKLIAEEVKTNNEEQKKDQNEISIHDEKIKKSSEEIKKNREEIQKNSDDGKKTAEEHFNYANEILEFLNKKDEKPEKPKENEMEWNL